LLHISQRTMLLSMSSDEPKSSAYKRQILRNFLQSTARLGPEGQLRVIRALKKATQRRDLRLEAASRPKAAKA